MGERKEEGRESSKILEILENWIPGDLTEHPDFPEYLEGYTHEKYAVKIENYWVNRRRQQLKRKMSDSETVDEVPDIDPAKIRKLEDFSEEEQKTIFDERVT